MARKFLHAYADTFKPQEKEHLLTNFSTETHTDTLERHSKQYRQKIRLKKRNHTNTVHRCCTYTLHNAQNNHDTH